MNSVSEIFTITFKIKFSIPAHLEGNVQSLSLYNRPFIIWYNIPLKSEFLLNANNFEIIGKNKIKQVVMIN